MIFNKLKTTTFAILCFLLPILVQADVLPPHKRPFPAASIVAACIAGGIILAGMTLAFLLALPRVLLFLRNKFVGDEEEEGDEEENQDAAQVANSTNGSTTVNNNGANIEMKNTVVHASAANLEA